MSPEWSRPRFRPLRLRGCAGRAPALRLRRRLLLRAGYLREPLGPHPRRRSCRSGPRRCRAGEAPRRISEARSAPACPPSRGGPATASPGPVRRLRRRAGEGPTSHRPQATAAGRWPGARRRQYRPGPDPCRRSGRVGSPRWLRTASAMPSAPSPSATWPQPRMGECGRPPGPRSSSRRPRRGFPPQRGR